MKRDRIFISYRRDDAPGYVSRLESELEREFGDERVFRDATDIPGGAKWMSVIDANLQACAVLLLVIGPRWEEIWEARKDDAVNHVALELNRAREFDVPVIPITLDGVQLSTDLDLGDLGWVLEHQFHDISDRQGRWRGDFDRLVRLLEGMRGIGAARRPADRGTPGTTSGRVFKWAAFAVVLVMLGATWMAMAPDERIADDVVVAHSDEAVAVVRGGDTPSPDAASAAPEGGASTQRPAVVPEAAPAALSVPNISGTWRGRDGTLYYVQQGADGSFTVESPGYASGRGEFFSNMPRKFAVEMYGVGRGEFSVSSGDQKAIGWIEVDGRQEYDTLVRVQ